MSLFDLIPSAYAQTAGQPASPGTAEMLQSFAPFVIIIVIFYFLMFRPQQQKAKALKAQLSALRRGDSVMTAGGIIGTVARVIGDNEVSLEIADGVRVRVIRSTITAILSKTEPAGDDKADGEAEDNGKKGRKKTAEAAVAADGDITG